MQLTFTSEHHAGISNIYYCKSYNCECPREFQYAPEKILHPIEIRSEVYGEGCRVWRWKVTRMLLPPWIAKGRLRFPTRRKCSPAVRSSRHAFCSSNLFHFLYIEMRCEISSRGTNVMPYKSEYIRTYVEKYSYFQKDWQSISNQCNGKRLNNRYSNIIISNILKNVFILTEYIKTNVMKNSLIIGIAI